MFSKPQPPSAAFDGSEFRSLAKEFASVAKALLPDNFTDGCVGRMNLAAKAVASDLACAPRIQTTVSRARASGAEAATCRTRAAAPRRAPGIRTTVGGACIVESASSASSSAGKRQWNKDTEDVVGSLDGASSASSSTSKRHRNDEEGFSHQDSEQVLALHVQPASTCRYELARYAMEVVGPAMLSAKLGGASPLVGMAMMPLGSAPPHIKNLAELQATDLPVGMAMMPPPGTPPTIHQAQQMAAQMQQLQQEDEQFMALIFPGFDSGAFIWQITLFQALEFVLSMLMGHKGANPLPCVLYQLGASWGPALARGQLWRLITPVMLHANLTHLLFNVFFQLRMGFGMEKQFGRNKMMLMYFACGVIGNLVSVNLDPFKLAVGASTAGFGLIGVWCAEILLSWELLGPARERTMIWIAFMLISVTTMSTMTPNMDLWGHLGGALGGFLLSIIISDMREEDRPSWHPQARAAAVVALGLLLTGGLTKAVLLTPMDPIPNCPVAALLTGKLNAAASQVLPHHIASLLNVQ